MNGDTFISPEKANPFVGLVLFLMVLFWFCYARGLLRCVQAHVPSLRLFVVDHGAVGKQAGVARVTCGIFLASGNLPSLHWQVDIPNHWTPGELGKPTLL